MTISDDVTCCYWASTVKNMTPRATSTVEVPLKWNESRGQTITVLQSKVTWNKCFKLPSQISPRVMFLSEPFCIWRVMLSSWVFTCVPESICTYCYGRVWLCGMNLVLYERLMKRKNKKTTDVLDWEKKMYSQGFIICLGWFFFVCFLHFFLQRAKLKWTESDEWW